MRCIGTVLCSDLASAGAGFNTFDFFVVVCSAAARSATLAMPGYVPPELELMLRVFRTLRIFKVRPMYVPCGVLT